MQTPVTSSEARSRRLQVQERVLGDARDRLILSTAFSVFSIPAVQPLIRLKQMTQCVPEYQLQRKPIAFKTGFGAALHIWRNEGVRRYWRGVIPAMAFTLPTMYAKHLSTLNFAQDLNNSPSIAGSIWRGAAVALIYSTAVSIFNVFDMVSTKMATDLRLWEVEEAMQRACRNGVLHSTNRLTGAGVSLLRALRLEGLESSEKAPPAAPASYYPFALRAP